MARFFFLKMLLVLLINFHCFAESSAISPDITKQEQPSKYCGTTQWKPFFEAIQNFCQKNESSDAERHTNCQKLLPVFSYCHKSIWPQKHAKSFFHPPSTKTIATFRKLGFFVLQFQMDDHKLWSITFSRINPKNDNHQLPMKELNWTVLGMSKEK